MRAPIITLTTDFGLSDHYAGVMKGVILSICPQARIVDISHQIAPFDIAEGAYLIAQAYPYFPPKTIHVAVVDPGVGTTRRPILAQAASQYFIGPDNGVFAMVYSREKYKARLISNQKYFRKPVSRTFHGRDIFAPVAAYIAAGVPVASVGKLIDDVEHPAFEKPQPLDAGTWAGRILKIDRFGNIVTNFHISGFPDLQHKTIALSIGRQRIGTLSQTYAESAPGELFLIFGSSGYLEVSVSLGSAAKQLGCAAGAPAELSVR
jgi:S-adenosylmethionine hydrolase